MDYDDFFTSLFLWLKQQEASNGGVFERTILAGGFEYKGTIVTLTGPTGIWIPKGFEVPVSITTTKGGPYNDDFSDDGILNYRYRGADPYHRDNRALREAFKRQTPLVYFYAIKKGKYQAVYPVQIISDNPGQLCIEAAIDPALLHKVHKDISLPFDTLGEENIFSVRRYLTRTTKVRLHQAAFREYVLDAYNRSCTICRLQHPELLDAAHIIPDAEEGGEPVVPNGLSLCKIHHSAYDQNIIGITPDYDLRVRGDILDEIDGPMLEYGLKAVEGQKIILPNRKQDYPDKDRLAKRFEEFGKVG
ncbi:MAG: HNH endonuclease [Spirochaetales bacterium]|nr:HNH endonuclease [Spirochaetales bacterium]